MERLQKIDRRDTGAWCYKGKALKSIG